MANNIDLSYAREVCKYRFGGEDDWLESEVRVSIFYRPVQTGKKGAKDAPTLPDVTICKHWGVQVEFQKTSKRLGRCIYTFDADSKKEDDRCDGGATDFKALCSAILCGEFIVTGFEFYPDLQESRTSAYNNKHPYALDIVFANSKEHIIGYISPAKLLEVVRLCSRKYESKTYNFVFNNCQDFANHFRQEIAKSMSNIIQNQEPRTDWTIGSTVTAVSSVVAATGLLASIFYGAFKLSNAQKTENERNGRDSEEED